MTLRPMTISNVPTPTWRRTTAFSFPLQAWKKAVDLKKIPPTLKLPKKWGAFSTISAAKKRNVW